MLHCGVLIMASQNLVGINKTLNQVIFSREYAMSFGAIPRPGKNLFFLQSYQDVTGSVQAGKVTGQEGTKNFTITVINFSLLLVSISGHSF